jgi:predicted MFS family arabinose efflux permease
MPSRTYLLALLVVLSAFNQLDRQIVAILLEPIRREFGLSDVALGLMSGTAFAVLYGAFSIPAAVWAVTYNRRNLVAASAVFWGTMTLLSGLAQSFWQLLAGRIGIGIGEAGAMPASHAMISDLYGPHERATAMAAWSGGINLGIFLAFLVGGYLGQFYGWRTAFIVAGAATIAAALLFRLTTQDPQRSVAARSGNVTSGSYFRTLRLVAGAMWSDRVLRHITIGSTLTAVIGYGALSWIPSYLVRSHGLGVANIGLYLALVVGLGGAIGAFAIGRFTDVVRRRNVGWTLGVVGLVIVLTKPLTIGFYLSTDTVIALSIFVLPGLIATSYVGPSLAVLHNRMSPEARPAVSAVYLLIVNVVGLSIGPLIVGMMSQWVFSGSGAHSLRYALVVMQVAGIWGGVHFLMAGRLLSREPAPAH